MWYGKYVVEVSRVNFLKKPDPTRMSSHFFGFQIKFHRFENHLTEIFKEKKASVSELPIFYPPLRQMI